MHAIASPISGEAIPSKIAEQESLAMALDFSLGILEGLAIIKNNKLQEAKTMRSKKIKWQWLSAAIISLLMFSAPAFAGSLEPSAPPGPTMKTLDQIPPTWDRVLPASERFKLVMGGEAILDRETGLVWERTPNPERVGDGKIVWSWALDRCYNRNIGGRMGWRVPTIEELTSLVDRTQSNPALPSDLLWIDVGLSYPIGPGYYNYWSATTDARDTSKAWAVKFYDGTLLSSSKSSFVMYVWCVRGGHGHDGQ